ncbi:16S rRNA (cytosine(1402)-N(4))-methyltransferase RsmH [Buchnera aphidicola (Chaitoregma tattakana)]|uniref:16S rRNA (cytosine(1402)-N(4))-methyltransferase RsmH n=1 Tax=Buchnera aphidicola TaxID=9 RepID=UPI0031B7F4BC
MKNYVKENNHIPVLLKEVIKFLKIKKNGIYIDCTFGTGGHSKQILKRIGKNGFLYSLDKDPSTIKYSKKIISKNFKFINDSFKNLFKYTKKFKINKKVDGILLDLGFSNNQIKNPNRGFSFMLDGPLDMRFNQKRGITAQTWINSSNANEIQNVIKKFGQEKFSKQISKNIVKYRKKKKIKSTLELSNIINKSIYKKNRKRNPSTKTFQAIRIHINKELKNIKKILEDSLKILSVTGRLLVISFNSLEDKIVKKFMKINSTKMFIPSKLPITNTEINILNKGRRLKIFKKIKPSNIEINKNVKSRSAILRIAELINC